MDELAPEAVTKALYDHIEYYWDGVSPLEYMAPALARDWLRLKKVEEAGKRLEDAASAVSPFIGYQAYVPDLDTELIDALAAFRAAVEDDR